MRPQGWAGLAGRQTGQERSHTTGLHQSTSDRLTNSVAALLSHAHKLTHSRQHQRQPPHVTTSDAGTWAPSFIMAGDRGRILPLRIRTTANLASAVDPSSSHLQQFQTGKRTTDDPIAHLPRLSFRTSFSFSPFGFSSVPFVTRYYPVAQSLFHTLSHRGRLSGTCHSTPPATRRPHEEFASLPLNLQQQRQPR